MGKGRRGLSHPDPQTNALALVLACLRHGSYAAVLQSVPTRVRPPSASWAPEWAFEEARTHTWSSAYS